MCAPGDVGEVLGVCGWEPSRAALWCMAVGLVVLACVCVRDASGSSDDCEYEA